MDIISHSLWGGLILGKNSRSEFLWASTLSVMPDIFAEGIMFGLYYLGVEGIPGFDGHHPNITEFPRYVQNFYNITHSLIVFIGIFTTVWIIRGKAYWPLLAWGLHIIIDIPTHSIELFPTPFLFPLSDFKIDGISWDNKIIFIPNIILLLTFYSYWFVKHKKSASKKEK